jgi:hypothetical protein
MAWRFQRAKKVLPGTAVDAGLADRDTPKAGGFDGICFELAPRMKEVLLRFPRPPVRVKRDE